MSTKVKEHIIAPRLSKNVKVSYLFEITDATCKLSVVSFSVEEQISSPFEVDITVATQDEVVLDDLLEKQGLLTVSVGASKRYFHGIVRECTSIEDSGDYSIFHIYLVPLIWLLSLEQDCRIFQHETVQDIVLKILGESGIGSNLVRLALKDKARERKYCVQYRETDLNFISRLLEEEGIFYFFEHYKDKHVIVFADNPKAYLPIQGKSEVKFNIDGGNVADEESVSSFIYSLRLHPGKVTLRDFNYQKVNLDLTTEKKTKKASEREVYDYPGNYLKQEKGDFVTQINKERIQVLGETAEGQSTSPRIMPGYVWELTNNDFAGNYLTIGVSHSGSQPQVLGEQAGSGEFSYYNSFVVIPSDVTFRPQLVSEKPIITGVQTATVVGPEGKEIYTDKNGQIAIQFHWDRLGQRNARSSCMIRVAQSWGGLGRGSQFIPRIGDEVLVEFAEGDPDRPVAIGSVYNGNNQPINNPEQSVTQSGFRTKTHKGEGFNELRFDDKNGAEEIFIHAQKDWNITVKDSKSQAIGGSSSTTVAKSLSETAEDITLTAKSKITLVCGGSTIIIDSSGISIKGGKINLNE